ncbi:hypothetical protein P154DRAFT_519081, partial [Amniculicola lignicola CBS 123094]
MGRWQPFLYNAPQRDSIYDVPDDFNPKAVTMASRQPPEPKKKAEGPLVNFNRHPDSHLILPYGQTNAKAMSPRTALFINIARWIQFVFRVCNMLGAIGALLCGIFIRGAQTTEGYIIRIPPGVDIVTALYAIYHLLRSAKSRPAASSASYHFFAMVTDAGFIPFYVFTAILSKRSSDVEPGTQGRWRTFFPTDEDTNAVLTTTWLTATTVAGLHFASLVLDLYLILVFRKIARLPPDMNPLEDNLTSRRKTKHKHKNSSISAMTPLTADEKRFSAQSGGTTISDKRYSQGESLINEKEVSHSNVPQVPFMHTRNNSGTTYSPHTPRSAHYSRQSLYSQPGSARHSRGDLNRREDLHRREDEDENETLAQRKSLLAQQAIKRNSRPQSFVSSKQEYYTPPSTANTANTANRNEATGDLSLQRESLQSDNWFVHGEPEEQQYQPPPPPPKQSKFPTSNKTKGYNAVATQEDESDDEYDTPMVPQPLRMNPPTPPPTKTYTPEPKNTSPSKLQRTLTAVSMSSEATFTRSLSRPSTPKSRYYGDLKAATQNIRRGSPANSPSTSPTKNGFGPNGLPSAAKAYTTNSPAGQNVVKEAPFSLDKKTFASVRRTGETGHVPVQAVSPRVVSRTGVDYVGNYTFEGDNSDLGTSGRRRDVSGKIAEEGRGGQGNYGRWGTRTNELVYRKVSGV